MRLGIVRKSGFLIILLSLLAVSCTSVYFNTFFNAKKAFNEAEGKRQNKRSSFIDKKLYTTAIEKSLKVVDNHPTSKYYDDALYVLGVSYFYTGQYGKAERRFREILANFEKSQFVNDATIYLAKSKLQLGEVDDAMEIFQEIFQNKFEKTYKAESAIALGKFYFEEKEFDQSLTYMQAVRDSLGEDLQKLEAQMYIADSHFDRFRFADALDAYLQILGMNPDNDQKYRALYQAAVCSFRLQRINAGMDYLGKLIQDPIYYDSVGALNLLVAEGYEFDGDLDLAEDTYREVADKAERKFVKARAYYRLGLIYQFDYDSLTQAKEFYDECVDNDRSSDFSRDALQRSTDIGKLATFSKAIEVDTGATQEATDDAAYSQFLLAELYWFQLDKPDSAIAELTYLIDSFPTAYDAPNAMISLSQMYRDYRADTAAADSILHSMLNRYPHSDYVPEALDALGLTGSPADTGYAERYLHRAEDFLFDEDMVDSARASYQYIVDNFPESRHFTQAKFNLIWLEEMYDNPGDSTVYYAYRDFIDSFPESDFAKVASDRINARVRRPVLANAQQNQIDSTEQLAVAADKAEELSGEQALDETPEGSLTTKLQGLYITPDGDTTVLLDADPIETLEQFEFPTEAYSMQDNAVMLYFQVLLDFSGKVVDYNLRTPSTYDEINVRAQRTVASMTFDPTSMSTLISTLNLPESRDGRGHWFVFKYVVEKPEFLR